MEALQGSAADVDVQCSNSGHGSGHIAFKHMLHATERSVFALALAGDSPSSRRLSEIFMAGIFSTPRLLGSWEKWFGAQSP